MKAQVIFWKNWDATFGARINTSFETGEKRKFPTCYVFRNNEVDTFNSDTKEDSDSTEAEIDFVSREEVLNWANSMISSLRQLITTYLEANVPENFEVNLC